MSIHFQESTLRSITTTITATNVLEQNRHLAGPDTYLVQYDNIMLINQSQTIQIQEQQEEIQRLQQQIFDMRAVEERRFAIAYQWALQERDHAVSEMEFMRMERDQAYFLCGEAANLRDKALRERNERIWDGRMEEVVRAQPEEKEEEAEDGENPFGIEKDSEERGKGEREEEEVKRNSGEKNDPVELDA